MKALVWPVVMYGCESWTIWKNEETGLEAFEMKGLRKILRVSSTAKKTNECMVLASRQLYTTLGFYRLVIIIG